LNKSFISNTLNFFRTSNLQLLLPTISYLEINENGGISSTSSYTLNFSENQLQGNWVLVQQIFFSLLDSVIDLQNSNLEGDSFSKRYRGLPSDSNHKIIFKEMYRLMRIVRNAIVHNKTAISNDNTGILINYLNQHNKKILLKVSHRGLRLINTINFLLCVLLNRKDGYSEHILNMYYHDLRNEISSFSDEFKKELIETSTPISFNPYYIHRVKNTKFKYINNNNMLSLVVLDEKKND